jgi:hypothetical protein
MGFIPELTMLEFSAPPFFGVDVISGTLKTLGLGII